MDDNNPAFIQKQQQENKNHVSPNRIESETLSSEKNNGNCTIKSNGNNENMNVFNGSQPVSNSNSNNNNINNRVSANMSSNNLDANNEGLKFEKST